MSIEVFLLTFARVAPVVALHPVFGGRSVPRPALAGLAAALAVAIATAQPATGVDGAFLALALKEIAVGSGVGLVGHAVFGAIEAAGRAVDDARGASVAETWAPQFETTSSPLGGLDLQAAIALFWCAGLHAPLVAALAASYDAVPLGAWPALDPETNAARLALALDAAGALAHAALAIAGPAAATCFLVDAVLGTINRASPQTNVFFLSLPLKLSAAVLVTALGMPARTEAWGELIGREAGWIEALLDPRGARP